MSEFFGAKDGESLRRELATTVLSGTAACTVEMCIRDSLRDILGELEKRVGPMKRDSEKAEQFLAYPETRKGLEISLWVDSIRRAQDTVRDQQRKYEAAESDYARISRQLDEFDTRTEALRLSLIHIYNDQNQGS